MAHLFKPTITKTDPITGKRVKYKNKIWWCKYRDASGIIRKISLGVRDKGAAQALMNELVRRVENERSGIIDPVQADMSDKLTCPIKIHTGAYQSYLQASEVSAKHLKETLRRLDKVIEDCSFTQLVEIKPEKVRNWLSLQADTGMSARTRNTYLASLQAFINWGIKEGRLQANPLVTVSKAKEADDVQRDRRSLTIEEAGRLIAAAKIRSLNELLTVRRGPNRGKMIAKVGKTTRQRALKKGMERALIYQTAIQTGLRRGELKLLEWGDLHLDSIPYPYIALRAKTTKARRAEMIPLRRDLVEIMKSFRPADSHPTDRVFARIPNVDTLRGDLRAAGILYKDENGRVVDFHALRHTFGTLLSAHGIMPRTAQSLMRHSDISLTMNTYTDPRLLDLQTAIESLPKIGSGSDVAVATATGTDNEKASEKFVPLLVPTYDKTGQNGAFSVTAEEKNLPKTQKRKMAQKGALDREKRTLTNPDRDSGRWESNPHDQLGRLGLYH